MPGWIAYCFCMFLNLTHMGISHYRADITLLAGQPRSCVTALFHSNKIFRFTVETVIISGHPMLRSQVSGL